jgi:hypothetical protein
MAKGKRFLRQHAPSFDQQIYRMGVLWPKFALDKARRQVEAIWKGFLQPSPMSENYLITLRYRPAWNPETRVLSPELKVREGFKDLPHINPDGSLCLHVMGDWQPWMYIADYIIPWVSTWLYFYEVWYATGNWLGGGTHPDKPEHRSD